MINMDEEEIFSTKGIVSIVFNSSEIIAQQEVIANVIDLENQLRTAISKNERYEDILYLENALHKAVQNLKKFVIIFSAE